MDVYDFDGTLYRGDSTADFLKWCARRHPRVIGTLPRTAAAAISCFGMHNIEKTQFKESLYRFLPRIPDIESEVRRFWHSHEKRITGPCHPKPGDLVISASPEFLLRDVCKRRGLMLVASRVDPHTGRVLGPNCSNEEKAARLFAQYPDATIERFFSDSLDDTPLARLAKKAFLIEGHERLDWPI